MVGLVLVAAVLASCSTTEGEADRDDARHEPTWTAGPAFPRAAPYAVVTSLDELLIAQNLSAVARFDPPDMDQQWFAARRDDGAWAALPNPPEPYESSALASIAGSVVLAGIVCDDRSECVTGRTEWSRLTDDLTEWEAIGEPAPFENRREAVVTAMPGRHEVGVFDTPAGRVSVDAGGRISSVPSNTGGSMADGSACIVGTTLVEVLAPVTNLEDQGGSGAFTYGTTEISTFDLADTDGRWTTAPAPPAGVPASARAACLDDSVLLLHDGVETVYRPADSTWTTRPDPAGALLAGRSLQPGSSDGLTDDGALYVITGPGFPILRRGSDGRWSDTGLAAAAVTTTGAVAYAVHLDEADVEPVPDS